MSSMPLPLSLTQQMEGRYYSYYYYYYYYSIYPAYASVLRTEYSVDYHRSKLSQRECPTS